MNRTPIEWADFTSNPIRARHKQTGAIGHACTKIAPGCANCYASRLQARFRMPDYSPASADLVEPFLDERELKRLLTCRPRGPFKGDRVRPLVFLCDMTDLFHDRHEEEWIDQVLATVQTRRDLDFAVLTKRPARMSEGLRFAYDIGAQPPPNLWLGVSVSTQRDADENISHLLNTPCAVSFVSYEPAIGPANFDQHLGPAGVNWLIVGGESGPGARPCDVAWIRSAVQQCQRAGVACFVKQVGSRSNLDVYTCAGQVDRKGGDPTEWPADLRVREWPKEATR